MSLFNKLADKYRDNLAVISDKEEPLTYADLDSISRRIKDRIQKRSLVFCLCENTIGSFCG